MKIIAVLMGLVLAGCTTMEAAVPVQTTWTFDNLTSIGGAAVQAEGGPRVIDTPLGKAVEFDGVDDALFIDNHPLAGMEEFTFEAYFRPDGGNFEQRWFHLAADETPGSAPVNARFLFEIRVVEDKWYLDAFTTGPGYNKTLIQPDKLFPVGQWYHVAQTFDGKTYKAFVNGVLQDSAEIPFKAQGPGKSSVGVRINRVNYFKGAVQRARFTNRALSVPEFLAFPAK